MSATTTAVPSIVTVVSRHGCCWLGFGSRPTVAPSSSIRTELRISAGSRSRS